MSSSDQREPAGEVVLSVQGVGKCYQMQRSLWKRKAQNLAAEHWALRDISFELRRGESFAILGRNGSGKSTLLQLITGNLQLTEGRIEVSGRIGALLELGSGFNPEFTGRENVRMQGVLMGFTDREIDDLMPTIEEFADIGEFFDEPVRTYSSGMFVRVAFAVQVQTEPDILIVDEALAVGDALFQKRCYHRLEALRSKGITLLFVSHDQETVRSLTQRALLLDSGKEVMLGTSGETVLAYRKLLFAAERVWHQQVLDQMTAEQRAIHQREAHTQDPKQVTGRRSESSTASDSSHRNPSDKTERASDGDSTTASSRLEFGEGSATVLDVKLVDADGAECNVFETSAPMRCVVKFGVERDQDHLNVSLRIRNRQGVKVYSWGTLNQDMAIRHGLQTGEEFWGKTFTAGTEHTVEFSFECRLGADFYEVQAAISLEETPDYKNQRLLHWRDEAAFFQVTVDQETYFFGGAFDLQMRASADLSS